MLFLASTFSSAALQLPARSSVASHSRVAVSMIAPVEAETETKKAVEGPTFSKPLATPDPIPEEGQKRALELMKSGALFRYTPGVESETALAEWDMTERTGFKYAVGFNSCGSALFIALKTCGVQPGDHVLANGFSFTAVPSAIHHAGAIPVYVECTDAYVMDMEDLERKIKDSAAAGTKIKFLMLTHMRGKEHDITVIEDCAHALGIMWDGVQLGRSASVACYSSQSAKVINSGEGGFFMTDDDELAARAACYAGCYEQLYLQHVVAPPAAVFDRVKFETPNYSLRMSDLAAACVRPQIRSLDARIAQYNRRYAIICEALEGCASIDIPAINPRVTPVSDSLQFNLQDMSPAQVDAFLAACKRRGMPVGLFGSKENARNYENWQYSPAAGPLPNTKRLIAAAIDVRLPAEFDDSDFPKMAAVILAAVDDALEA